MIRITCSSEDYIRCRTVHPKGTTDYQDDKFSEQEIRVMSDDPKLKIEVIAEDPSEKGSKNKSKK